MSKLEEKVILKNHWEVEYTQLLTHILKFGIFCSGFLILGYLNDIKVLNEDDIFIGSIVRLTSIAITLIFSILLHVFQKKVIEKIYVIKFMISTSLLSIFLSTLIIGHLLGGISSYYFVSFLQVVIVLIAFIRFDNKFAISLISFMNMIFILWLINWDAYASDTQKSNLIIGILIFSTLAVYTIIHNNSLRFAKYKTNLALEKEKNLSNQLLLNILPDEIASELKDTGKVMPRYYDSVSVLFTDFVDFSKISREMTAETLVEELDFFFTVFDSIIAKYNIEKIKTIGDSYMCASGIPATDKSSTTDIVKAAIEIVNFMINQPKRKWKIRLGIHTGPLTAGIIGKDKFIYDIWGDTVNLASRIESNGEINKVNLSESTYDIVSGTYPLESVKKVYAKNIGEVNLYTLENISTPITAKETVE